MKLDHLQSHLNTTSIRSVLESKPLAHLGDFLANFMFTQIKFDVFGLIGSIHVWDNSLRDAMVQADLRKLLGKKTKPDRVADAAEALIAFAYYNHTISLQEGVLILKQEIQQEDFISIKREKIACANAFAHLLSEITKRLKEKFNFVEFAESTLKKESEY